MKQIIFYSLMAICYASCSTSTLTTKSVGYQSVRPVLYKPQIPSDAKIVVSYSTNELGEIFVSLRNNTDDILTIDQTKSFLVDSNNESKSFYDPTIKVSSNTNTYSETTASSLSLSGLGILGPYGVSMGEAESTGHATTHTTFTADQPQFSLGPRSFGLLGKHLAVTGLGRQNLSNASGALCRKFTASDSNCKFSVCLSYSFDDGRHYDKLVTNFYVNSMIAIPVKSHGRVNDAIRSILTEKTDAVNEVIWLMYFNNTFKNNQSAVNGVITDFR